MGVAKLTEADGLETCQGLRSNRVATLGLYRLEATTLCGKGAGGFSLHPCHVANAGVGSAHGVGKTLGGRAVGKKCAVGTHFKGFWVYKAQSQLCVGSVAKAAPCALRPLIT